MQTARCLLPSSVPTNSIQRISLERLEHRAHLYFRRLGISKDVAALLRVDTRDAVPGTRQCQHAKDGVNVLKSGIRTVGCSTTSAPWERLAR